MGSYYRVRGGVVKEVGSTTLDTDALLEAGERMIDKVIRVYAVLIIVVWQLSSGVLELSDLRDLLFAGDHAERL